MTVTHVQEVTAALATFAELSRVINPLTLLFSLAWAGLWYRNTSSRLQGCFLLVTVGSIFFISVNALTLTLDPCAGEPNQLEIAEYCAVGRECGPQEDFVRIRNNGARQARLHCYALQDHHSGDDWGAYAILSDEGSLGPGATTVVSTETDLGFRIDKDGDKIRLLKLRMENGRIATSTIDAVQVNSAKAYGCRRADDPKTWFTINIDPADASSEDAITKHLDNKSNPDLVPCRL